MSKIISVSLTLPLGSINDKGIVLELNEEVLVSIEVVLVLK